MPNKLASKFWESVGGHVGDYKSQILPVRGTAPDNNQKESDVVVKTAVTTQPILVTGTPLTVIGEAVKDRLGRIQIQRPERGPFYVSRKNFDKLSADFKGAEWSWKCVSVVLSSCGIFLIGMHTFQYIKRIYLKQKPHKRFFDAVTETLGTDDKESKAEAGDGSGVSELNSELCAICLEQEYNSVLVPCGHMCCCEECSSPLTECPLCREPINQVVRVFRG